jgi:hypothetical protein
VLSHLTQGSAPVAGEDTVQAWLALPRRVYLDTSTLQTLYDFGDVVFEAEPFAPEAGRVASKAWLTS